MEILHANKLSKSYGNKWNKQEVLKKIDLRIYEGEFVSIMGASGSGKTTLLNVLSTIDRASGGSILANGMELTGMKEKHLAEFRKKELGFIFQEYNLLDSLTVKENIILPLTVQKVSKKEASSRFETIAKQLGIEELANKYPNELSGGQKQRTSAARAFIHEPSIIFADEPTGALDSKAASSLLEKLSQLNEQRKATIMMVTHDPAAASYGSSVVFIKDGEIFTRLTKGGQSKKAFFKDIMQTQAVLGGVHDE
ncbi:ABC transporter ATP-binding protein [Shouchella sp. JSM 1781072]|uniref:ABC transporter ATP-binding protein n=1 Tax=Shouchella sp. JSM 1781072 TaxID=3344581 RepID=UPI0035C08E45